MNQIKQSLYVLQQQMFVANALKLMILHTYGLRALNTYHEELNFEQPQNPVNGK
jgi:hypothetical protein